MTAKLAVESPKGLSFTETLKKNRAKTVTNNFVKTLGNTEGFTGAK